jgi:hypothetical protein
MRRATVTILLLFLLSGWSAVGQQSGRTGISIQGGEPAQGMNRKKDPATQVQKSENRPLTNSDVISMVKAKLDESTILLAIRRSATNFDTSPQALITLKNEGVPQKVLNAMLAVGTEKPTAHAGPAVLAPTASRNSANQDIISELQAGMKEGWIIDGILQSPSDFKTTPEAIEELRSQGASDRLINVVVETQRRRAEYRRRADAHMFSPVPLERIRKIYVSELYAGTNTRYKKDIPKSKCLELTDNPAEADAILSISIHRYDLSGDNDISCTSNSVSSTCEGGNVGIRTDCIGDNCTSYTYDPGLEVNWKFFDPDTRDVILGWSSKSVELPKRKEIEKAVGCP